MNNHSNSSSSTALAPSSSSSSFSSHSHPPPSSHANTMGLTDDTLNGIVDRLTQGILPNEVKFRPIPGGRQCAYLAADDIIGVANETFGFHRWSCEIKNLNLIHATRDAEARWTVAYSCTMKVSFGTNPDKPLCYHEDVGYGTAERQSKADAAFEQAMKSAITDARKRCLRLFGPSLGQNVNSEEFQKQAQTARQQQQQQQYQQKQQGTQSATTSSLSSSSGTSMSRPPAAIPSVNPSSSSVPSSSSSGFTNPPGTFIPSAQYPPLSSSSVATSHPVPSLPSTSSTVVTSVPVPPTTVIQSSPPLPKPVESAMVLSTSPPSHLLPHPSASVVTNTKVSTGSSSTLSSVPLTSIPPSTGTVLDDKLSPEKRERENRKRRAEMQREEFLKRMAMSSGSGSGSADTSATSTGTTSALNTSNPLPSVSSATTLPDTSIGMMPTTTTGTLITNISPMSVLSSSPPMYTPQNNHNNLTLVQSFIPPSSALPTFPNNTITLNNNKANTGYNFDLPNVSVGGTVATVMMNTSQNIPPSSSVPVSIPPQPFMMGNPTMSTYPPVNKSLNITSVPPMNNTK